MNYSNSIRKYQYIIVKWIKLFDTKENEWSYMDVTGDDIDSRSNFASVLRHTAILYYNYMIITFGYDIDNQTYSSKAYLYDITNNTWVIRFESSPSTTSTPEFLKPLLIGLGTGIDS
ncbi:hypothetical protein Glove_40g104 [Diversispora epigaea]|uniref:Uncharacterized protein n=1 Tax=Diversispora epigaea TaxID=1348612 RepID=A0A397JIS8_9GLOM|nr:hypothetical protein Glove_40g104 [Diversispora epigaea]